MPTFFNKHAYIVMSLDYSPNGEYIVTACNENGIYIWSTENCNIISKFPKIYAV